MSCNKFNKKYKISCPQNVQLENLRGIPAIIFSVEVGPQILRSQNRLIDDEQNRIQEHMELKA